MCRLRRLLLVALGCWVLSAPFCLAVEQAIALPVLASVRRAQRVLPFAVHMKLHCNATASMPLGFQALSLGFCSAGHSALLMAQLRLEPFRGCMHSGLCLRNPCYCADQVPRQSQDWRSHREGARDLGPLPDPGHPRRRRQHPRPRLCARGPAPRPAGAHVPSRDVSAPLHGQGTGRPAGPATPAGGRVAG